MQFAVVRERRNVAADSTRQEDEWRARYHKVNGTLQAGLDEFPEASTAVDDQEAGADQGAGVASSTRKQETGGSDEERTTARDVAKRREGLLASPKFREALRVLEHLTKEVNLYCVKAQALQGGGKDGGARQLACVFLQRLASIYSEMGEKRLAMVSMFHLITLVDGENGLLPSSSGGGGSRLTSGLAAAASKLVVGASEHQLLSLVAGSAQEAAGTAREAGDLFLAKVFLLEAANRNRSLQLSWQDRSLRKEYALTQRLQRAAFHGFFAAQAMQGWRHDREAFTQRVLRRSVQVKGLSLHHLAAALLAAGTQQAARGTGIDAATGGMSACANLDHGTQDASPQIIVPHSRVKVSLYSFGGANGGARETVNRNEHEAVEEISIDEAVTESVRTTETQTRVLENATATHFFETCMQLAAARHAARESRSDGQVVGEDKMVRHLNQLPSLILADQSSAREPAERDLMDRVWKGFKEEKTWYYLLLEVFDEIFASSSPVGTSLTSSTTSTEGYGRTTDGNGRRKTTVGNTENSNASKPTQAPVNRAYFSAPGFERIPEESHDGVTRLLRHFFLDLHTDVGSVQKLEAHSTIWLRRRQLARKLLGRRRKRDQPERYVSSTQSREPSFALGHTSTSRHDTFSEHAKRAAVAQRRDTDARLQWLLESPQGLESMADSELLALEARLDAATDGGSLSIDDLVIDLDEVDSANAGGAGGGVVLEEDVGARGSSVDDMSPKGDQESNKKRSREDEEEEQVSSDDDCVIIGESGPQDCAELIALNAKRQKQSSEHFRGTGHGLKLESAADLAGEMTAEQIDVVHFRGKQPEHEMAILRHLDCLNFLGGPAFMDHDSSNSTPQQVRVAAFLSRSGLACAEFFAQQEKFSDCFGVLHLLLSSPQFGTHHGLSAYASDSLLAICDVYYQFGSVSLQDDVFRELIDSATACFDPTTSSNLVTPSSVAASGKSRPAAVLLRRIVNMLNLFCRFSENPYACDVFASVRKLVAQIEHPYDSYLEDSFAESVSPADEEFLFGEASPVAAARGQKQTSPGFAKAAAESSSGVADHLHGTRKKRDEMKRKVHIAPEKAVNAGIWGRGARVLGPFAVRQWEKADPKTGGSLQIRNNPMAVCPRPEYESAAAMLRTLLLEDVPLGRCLLGDDSAVGKCGLAMVLLVCSFFRDPTSRRWLAPLATVSLMCLVKGGIELRDVAVGMSSPAKDDKNTKSAAGGKSVYGDSTSTRSSAFVAGGGSTSSFSGKDGSSSLFKGKDGSSISLKAAGRLVFHGRSYEDSATVNSTVGVGNSNGSEFLHLVRLTFKMLHSAQNTYLEMCSLFQEVTRTHKDLVLKYPYALVSLLIGTDAPASMEEGRRAILSQAFFDRQLYPELFEAEGTTLLLDNAIDNIRKQETEDLLDQVLNQSAQQEAASSTVGENNNPSGSGTSARRRAENLVVEQKTFLNYRSFTHLLLTAVLRIDCDFSRTFKREYQLGGSSSTANSVGGSPSTSTSVDAAVDIGQEISRRVAAIVMRSVCTWFGGECGPDSWYQALFVAVESGALSTQDADVILPGWSDHCNVITQRSSSTRSSPADVVSVVLPVKLYSLRELRLSASPAALFSLEFSNSRVFSSANPGSPEMQQPNHILSLALSSLKHLRVFDQRLPAGLNFLHSSLPYFCLKLFGAAFFQDASREKFLTDLSRQQLDEKKRAKPCRRYTHLFHPLVLPKFLVSHFFDSVRLQPGSFSQVGPDIFNPLWKFWTFDKRQDNAWISTAISAAADRDYVLGRLHPQDKDNIELFGKIADAVADEGVSSSGAAEAEMSTPSGAASTTTTMISVSDSAALAVDAAFLKQGQNLSSLLQRVPLLESETLMIDELKTLLRHGFECASPLLGSSESRSSSALVVMPDRSSAGFNDTRVLPALQEFGTRGSSVLGSAMYHLANVSLDVALSQGQSVRAWQVVLESYLQLYCAALDRTAAYESVDKSQSFVRKNCPDLFVRTQQEEDDSKKRKITVMPKAKAKAGAPPASGGGSAVASSSAEDQGGSQMLVLNNSEVRKLSVIGTTEKHAAYTKEDDLRELLFRQCLGVSSWLVADALRACRTEVTKLRKGQQLLRGGPALLKQSARRWLLSCADVLSVLLLDSSVVPKRRSVLLTHVFVHRMLHFLLQCSDAAALLPGVVSYFRQESSGAELRGPAAIGTASGGLRNKYSAPFVQILMEVKPEVRKQAGVDILLELEGKSGVPGELLWFLPFALARHLERFETGLPARDRKATITALCQDAFAMAKRCGADGQLESLYRLRKFQIKSCVNPSERKTLYDKFLQGFEQIVVAADAQQRGEGMQSAARRSDLEEQRRKSANGEGTEGANNNGNSANANYAKKARLYCARACFSIVRDFMRSIVGQGRDDFHENLQEEAYSWMRKGIAFLESVAEALPLQDLDLLLGDQKQDSYFGNCAMNPADQQWREHIPFSFLYEDAGEQLSSSGSSGGIASNKASTSTSSGALSSTTFDGTTSQKSCSRHDPWALLLEKRRYSLETEVYVRGCGTMLMCLSRAAQTQTLNPKTRPEKCNLPKTQFQSDVPLPALRVAIQKSTFKPILKMIQATVQLHTVFENVRGGDEARMAQTVMEQHTRCLLAKMVVPRVAEFFTPSWHVCHTLYIVSRYCGFCAREFEDALYHFILAEFCGCVPEANKRFMTTNAAACFPGLKPQEWVRERLADIKVAVSPFKFNLQRSQATHAAFTT